MWMITRWANNDDQREHASAWPYGSKQDADAVANVVGGRVEPCDEWHEAYHLGELVGRRVNQDAAHLLVEHVEAPSLSAECSATVVRVRKVAGMDDVHSSVYTNAHLQPRDLAALRCGEPGVSAWAVPRAGAAVSLKSPTLTVYRGGPVSDSEPYMLHADGREMAPSKVPATWEQVEAQEAAVHGCQRLSAPFARFDVRELATLDAVQEATGWERMEHIVGPLPEGPHMWIANGWTVVIMGCTS